MLKISYAGYLGLSPAILAQFTLEMRVTKTCYFVGLKIIQGHRCWHF